MSESLEVSYLFQNRLYVSLGDDSKQQIENTLNKEGKLKGASIRSYSQWVVGPALQMLGLATKVKVDGNYHYVNKNSLVEFLCRHNYGSGGNDFQAYANNMQQRYTADLENKNENQNKRFEYEGGYLNTLTTNIETDCAAHKGEYVDLINLMKHGIDKNYIPSNDEAAS